MATLAVADWPLTRRLLAAGTLEVDWLETTGFLVESVVERFPRQAFLLHNSASNWSLGKPAALVQQVMIEQACHHLRQTRAPWLSVHLGFSATEVVFDGWNWPLSPVIDQNQLFSTICCNVRALAAGIPVPLILENLDYCPGGAYEHVCEPDFIRAVLDETGAGLLLDVAHARVSAAQLGMPIDGYLARLPLERVRQLHVSGPRVRDGVLADAHEPLQEADYGLLEAVIAVTKPAAVTLEYHRNETALREQLRRLRAVLNRHI